MTDALTRWSISLGIGVFTLLGLVAGFHFATGDALRESFSSAVDQLVPERAVLDAAIEFDSYDTDEHVHLAQLLQDADVEREVGCGPYFYHGDVGHPTHVCQIDAYLPEALNIFDANANVHRDDFTLTVGEYHSKYEDILLAADTIRVQTDNGPQNATYEGGGTFTLSFLDQVRTPAHSAPWQFALAAVPAGVVWLALAGVAGVVAIVASVLIRQRPTEQVETVGVEFFDDKL